MLNSDLDNSRLEIPVSETPPGPLGIKMEPKEDCKDSLSAFMVELGVEPPPIKIENYDSSENNDEYGSLSEDYTVDVKKLKTEHSEDSKEWLNNYRIKSEENDQLTVSGEDQDDFTEDSNIKSEEMHIKEDDGINEPGISPISYNQEPQEIRRTTKRRNHVFQCPDCDFNTTRKRDITRHVARHQRKEKEAPKEYSCDICEYTTVQKARIQCHLQAHTRKGLLASQTQYECPECDYTTFQKGRMELHMLINGKHNDVSVLKCSDCDFNTTRKRDMIRHVTRHKRKQAANDGFACAKCNFKATTKASLRAHLLLHTSSEQAAEYSCDICEYTTVFKGQLQRHLRTHTKNGGRAPHAQSWYGCPECAYATFQKGRMELHMLIHGNHNDITVVKCYHCSYETASKTNLIKHLKRHRKIAVETLLFEEHLRLNCGSQSAENKQVSAISVTESVDNYKFRCQNCDYKTNWSSSFTEHHKQHETPKRKRKTMSL